MPTEFCQKCKQSHPGRACDYDDQGECAETQEEDNRESNDTGAARSAAKNKSNKD